MGSMGDWPEISVLSDAGDKSEWTREVNRKEQDALYRVGRPIEIAYVLQRHRSKNTKLSLRFASNRMRMEFTRSCLRRKPHTAYLQRQFGLCSKPRTSSRNLGERLESGLAIHSAPSFALGIARCTRKRKQGNRSACVRTSTTLGRYSSAIRAACANERSCGPVRRAISDGRPYRDLKMPLQRFCLQILFRLAVK